MPNGNQIASRLGRFFSRLEAPLLNAFSGDRDKLSIRILKVLTVVAPAFFIWSMEVVRNGLFGDRYNSLQVAFIIAFLATCGAVLFSKVVFGEVESIHGQVVRRNEELRILNTVASAVNQSLSLDTVLHTALEQVTHLTQADAAEIFLIDRKTQDLLPRAQAGVTSESRGNLTNREECPISRAATKAEAVLSGGSCRNENDNSTSCPRCSAFKCMACIPLVSQRSTIGVFTVSTLHYRKFTADDMRLLVSTGEHIAMAIENARLHEEVHAAAAIEEREHLAREMHDGVAQMLAYINVKTQTLKSFLSSGDVDTTQKHLQELEDSCQEAYSDVRESILGLRLATAHESLHKAIQEYTVRFCQMSDLNVDLDTDEAGVPPLTPAAEVQIIRIVQEALTNVRKHARATKASVKLKARLDEFHVTVEDNGQGFDLQHVRKGSWPQFGLQTMKERAQCVKGSLDILTAPGRGTIIHLTVPLAARRLT